MELITVDIGKVHPDGSNPRLDFGDIEALAASFDLNAERPGEPFTPPILVRDGGIFRIVDGERRYRALKLRGAERFAANVCDDMDEADSVVAMLATDDKMQLTDIERSRGVQKMLLLGVEPEKVERAARMKRGRASDVATAMALADERCEQMTLDRLYAVAEFADEPGTVDRLLACGENEWEMQAARARRDRESRALLAEMRAKAAEIGARLTDEDEEKPWDAGYRYEYHLALRTPGDLEDAYSEDPERWFTWRKPAMSSQVYFYCYAPKAEGEEEAADPAEDERRRAADELVESLRCAFAEMRAWFSSRVLRGSAASCPHLRDMFIDGFKDAVGYDELVDAFPALEQVDGWSRHDMAVGYLQRVPWEGCSQLKALSILGGESDWYSGDVPEMEEAFRAFEADGFRFEGDALAAREAVAAFMAAGDDDGGDGDGE